MPGQYGDYEHHGRCPDSQSHTIAGKSSDEGLRADGRNVWRSLSARDSLSGLHGREKCGMRRLPEIFHGADYNPVVQFMRVIGCFAVQRPDEPLLSWAQNVLGKASEIAERPQEIDSVPAGGGSVDDALIGIECDENPLREQAKLRRNLNASCFQRSSVARHGPGN